MYQHVKAVAKKIIPRKFLFENEEFLRFFHGIWYTGSNHQCNICGHQLRSFVTQFGTKQLCPHCGSLARTRRLYHMLNTEIGLSGTLLHFSPPRNLYRKLKKHKNIKYYSTDFEDEFLAEYRFDITNIATEDNFFDRIICYHILEHIPDDHSAMQELYRVLKPGGKVLIQTPFKEGAIYEDPSITNPQERLHHFGQEDHVRIYSVDGLVKRLKKHTFEAVEIHKPPYDAHAAKHGFLQEEITLIATKN